MELTRTNIKNIFIREQVSALRIRMEIFDILAQRFAVYLDNA